MATVNPFLPQISVKEIPSKADQTKTITVFNIDGLKIKGELANFPVGAILSTMRVIEKAKAAYMKRKNMDELSIENLTDIVENDEDIRFLIAEDMDKLGKRAGCGPKFSFSGYLNLQGVNALSGVKEDAGFEEPAFGEETEEAGDDTAKWQYTSFNGATAMFLALAEEAMNIIGQSESDPRKALMGCIARVLHYNTDTKFNSMTPDEIVNALSGLIREDLTTGGRIKKASDRIEARPLEQYDVTVDGETVTMDRWKLSGSRGSKDNTLGFE